MKENFGGELLDKPNEKYRLFFERFKEIESVKVEDWKVLHLIGYWCKLYKQHYNSDYNFKFNSSSPSKCFEVFQIKKLSQMMTSRPALLKQYIEWIFEHQIIKAKRKITSISFLTNELYVNDYKINVLLAPKLGTTSIDRFTKLPNSYKQATQKYNIDTYGELSFLYQSDKLNKIFPQLESLGLDIEVLGKII